MTDLITSQWLENVINRYLKLDPEGMGQLSALHGKVLCIDVLGLDKQYYIFPGMDDVGIDDSYDGEPDTIIKGTMSALVKLGLHSDTASLMLSGEVEIIGDVHSGRTFKKCMSNLDVDWEEQLASVVGDVPANIAFNALHQFSSWSKKVMTSLALDFSEYVQEESRDVVSGVELDIFNKKVDKLRDDVGRLEALINRRY